MKEYYLQASESGDSITQLAEPETQSLLQQKAQPLQRIFSLEKMLQMKADVYQVLLIVWHKHFQKRLGSCIIFLNAVFRKYLSFIYLGSPHFWYNGPPWNFEKVFWAVAAHLYFFKKPSFGEKYESWCLIYSKLATNNGFFLKIKSQETGT